MAAKLDFQQAKAKHLQFKSRLRDILYGEVSENESHVLSQYECPVGKWIYSEALANYHHIPQMLELERVHAGLHTVAHTLVDKYKAGQEEEAREGLVEIEAIAGNLMLLFDELELKVASDPQEVAEKPGQLIDTQQLLNELLQKNQALDRKISNHANEIRAQSDFYNKLLTVSPVVLWLTDKEGRFIFVNETFFKWTGLTRQNNLEGKWIEYIRPEDAEVVLAVYREQFEKRKKFEIQYKMVPVNGFVRDCLATGQPYNDKDGGFAGYTGSIMDVTERIAAEAIIEKQRNSERQLLHSFFMQAPAVLCIMRGPEHTFELANPGFQELSGRTDVIGKTVREALPELKGQGFFELLDNVFTSQEAYRGNEMPMMLHLETGDEQRYLNFIYQPILNGQGETDGILIFGYDVTNIHNARVSLEENEKRFRSMADFMPQFVWTADKQGNLNYYNRSVYNYSGHDTRSLEEAGWLSIVHPDERDEHLQLWTNSITSGNEFSFEHRFKKHDGQYRWQFSRAVPLRDDEGRIQSWVGISSDVHDHKMSTNLLEKMVDERTALLKLANYDLERSNEDLAQFAYVASHDLQEPLRKIMTFVDRMKNDPMLSPDIFSSYLDKIDNSAGRMSELIKDILEFSSTGRDKNKLAEVDLNKLVKDIQNDLEIPIQKRKAVITTGQLPIIRAIASQMQQLFNNLINNALKFTDPLRRQQITISATIVKGLDIPARFRADAQANYHKLTVADTGIGFDPAYADLIFTIFQRLHQKDSYEGTGIGLALCKKVVDNHQGFIYAEGEENKGAKFYIYLLV